MKIGIRSKLLLGFALLVGLSLLIQFIIFFAVDNYTRRQIDAAHLEKVISAGDEVTVFLNSIEQRANELAILYIDDTGLQKDRFSSFTKIIINSNIHIEKVSILSSTGREVIQIAKHGRVTEDQLSIELPTKELEKALKGQKVYSKVFYLNNKSSPYIELYYPIKNDKGLTLRVLKLLLNLNELWSVVGNSEHGKNGFAYIVDAQGILIAHPNSKLVSDRVDISNRVLIAELINKAADNSVLTVESIRKYSSNYIDAVNIGLPEEIRHYINESGQEVTARGLYIPGPNWFIIYEHAVAEAYSFPLFIRNVHIILVVASFMLLLFIAIILSNNLTNPIMKLKVATNLLTEGKLQTRAKVMSGDEIEDLANTFNVMASNMQDLVSKLEQEKEKLSGERNTIQVAISSITDGIIGINLERKIVIFNKAAENITGFSYAEVYGKPIETVIRFYTKDGEIPASVYSQIRTDDFEGVIYSNENLKLIAKKEVQVDLTTGKIKEAKYVNLGCILTLHDKTHEKELEEMKLDFVSMAAHELRTPLTSIRGYLSVLQEENIPLNDEQKLFLQRISIASDQLVSLVENLLNVTKIEKGVMRLNKKKTDIVDLAKNIIDQLNGPAAQKSIIITLAQPVSPVSMVDADAFRITEVITNLISNAINYTNVGGSVSISFEENDKEVITHITDTGQGIPESSLPHLFTKFYRVSGSLEQGSKGTGLGLYIAKAILDMHNGKIWVESELNKGSTFSFALPKIKYE